MKQGDSMTCCCTSAHGLRLPCGNAAGTGQLMRLQAGGQIYEQLGQAVVGGHSCDAGGLSLAPASMSHKDAPAESCPLQMSRTS